MQIPTSVDRSKSRGSRAVLASVTCRTDPTRLSSRQQKMHKVLSVARLEFASAIFSPIPDWSWNYDTGVGEKAESGAVGKLRL